MNLKGTVTRVFTAKDSGFKILALKVEDLKTIPVEKRNPDYPDSVSVVGLLKGVEENYVIDVVGDWENRPSGQYWPWQFKVSDVTVCEFETPVLMRRFLAEISEVGPELARRIQNVYPNTQEVIEKSPKKLTVIKGITEEKAMRIHRAFLEQKEKRSLAVFLQKFGLKNEDANKISSHYGSNAMKLIREDPYRLCNDNLYPFKLCDRIGKELGIPADAECRLKAALWQVLFFKAGAKGHVYLTLELLITETNAFFKDNAVIACSFSAEQLEKKLKTLTENGMLVQENGKYYHPDRYQNEKDVADILLRRSKSKSRYADASDALVNESIAEAEEEIGIQLDELQREAVVSAIQHSTVVITGGPGSGKTTLLNTYIKAIGKLSKKLRREAPSISLAAPTGMASKRMTASTGREARTIHKMFDIRYDLKINEEAKAFVSDIVVLDEVSMLDIDIMAYILRVMSVNTGLILLGDVDQIPSIGPGNVLSDIIESGVIPVARLKRSYRHGSRRTILTNATRINAGEENLETNRADFVFLSVPDKTSDKECRRLKAVTERVFCEEFLAGGKDPYRVQVISPLRMKTQASVDELNIVLQKIANPEICDTEQIQHGKVFFRMGDKVMQVSNNYEKGIYNGDVGVIKLVSTEKKRLQVDFQGLLVDYYENEFDQLKHAFATTVHKVQGGEYPVVIMVVTNYHSMMLLRNLLYTGVTRAKQRMILIGDEDAIKYAIRNTKGTKRLSALLQRLRQAA